jgi:hypothetical protein
MSEREVPMRTKRSLVALIDPLAADSSRVNSVPIFAVLAAEPIFGQLAREAHARFLAHRRLEHVAGVELFPQLPGADDLMF